MRTPAAEKKGRPLCNAHCKERSDDDVDIQAGLRGRSLSTVTVLASQMDDPCPPHTLSPSARQDPPSCPHHTGAPSCLVKWGKRRVTIAVLDHGLDRDWRHCPPFPDTDNGLTGKHNDCAAGGGCEPWRGVVSLLWRAE